MTTVRARWHRSWSAVPESVAEARREVTELARENGVVNGSVDGIRLAITEACANAVVHGGGDPKTFTVSAGRCNDTFEVAVRDHGAGIRPRDDSPGAGLGLPIIAAIAHDVQVCTPEDGVGTELRMTFLLH